MKCSRLAQKHNTPTPPGTTGSTAGLSMGSTGTAGSAMMNCQDLVAMLTHYERMFMDPNAYLVTEVIQALLLN